MFLTYMVIVAILVVMYTEQSKDIKQLDKIIGEK